MKDASMTVSTTLSKVATGKVRSIGPFGGPVVSYLFYNGFAGILPSTYFEDAYSRVSQIVRQSLDSPTVSRVDAAMRTAIERLRTEYETAKHSSNLSNADHRKKLFEQLQGIENRFLRAADGMKQVMERSNSPQAAFSVYLAGVSLCITLYQEMAVVDPRQRSPREAGRSSFGKQPDGTIAQFTKDSLEFATKTWNEIKAKRKAAITVGEGQFTWRRRMYDDLSTTSDFRQSYYAMWRFLPANDPQLQLAQAWENYAGPFAKRSAPPQMDFDAVSRRAIENFIETRALPELIQEMGDPDQIFKDWSSLSIWPLPIPA